MYGSIFRHRSDDRHFGLEISDLYLQRFHLVLQPIAELVKFVHLLRGELHQLLEEVEAVAIWDLALSGEGECHRAFKFAFMEKADGDPNLTKGGGLAGDLSTLHSFCCHGRSPISN
jgi:hypothetical protein